MSSERRYPPGHSPRKRNRKFLLLAIVLGILLSALIGFLLWVLNVQGKILAN